MDCKKNVNMPISLENKERMLKIAGVKFGDTYNSMFTRVLDYCEKMNQALDLDDLK